VLPEITHTKAPNLISLFYSHFTEMYRGPTILLSHYSEHLNLLTIGIIIQWNLQGTHFPKRKVIKQFDIRMSLHFMTTLKLNISPVNY
jgi:hypothetical protein